MRDNVQVKGVSNGMIRVKRYGKDVEHEIQLEADLIHPETGNKTKLYLVEKDD
jgi:hypothetical protein